jgi:hypothetical protein
MANSVNGKLLQFFVDHYKPGTVGVVGTQDLIGMAIREAQREITPDGELSLWSHCFVLGELRWDRRGPEGGATQSAYLFESDLKIKPFSPQIRNGAQENWIGKWCSTDVANAAVIDFGLTDDLANAVLATALQLVDEQVLYPIGELLGTWWSIITSRQWQENPLNDPHAMYCSSFVRYCYREAGRDFVAGGVSVSNTTPEDVAQSGIKAGAMVKYQG